MLYRGAEKIKKQLEKVLAVTWIGFAIVPDAGQLFPLPWGYTHLQRSQIWRSQIPKQQTGIHQLEKKGKEILGRRNNM